MHYKEPLLLFHHDGTKLANVSAAGRARPSRSRFRRAASPSATTTTTAGSTCSSATTAARRCCSRTTPARATTGSASSCKARRCNRDAVGADDHLVGRRHEAEPLQGRRRQLPVVARRPRGARARHRGEDGLDRDQVAAAERSRRALHGPADRSLRDRSSRGAARQSSGKGSVAETG